MLDLTEELQAITRTLAERGIEYALCGGLAMAVHGLARATVDIDLLVREEDQQRALEAAADLGFVLPAGDMTFASR